MTAIQIPSPVLWESVGEHSWRAPIQVTTSRLPLARSYVAHRLRVACAEPRGLLHPVEVKVGGGELTLTLSPPAPPLDPDEDPYAAEIIPALAMFAACLRAKIVGFAPHDPVGGRWLPPVSWFLPAASSPSDASLAAEMRHVASWLARQRSHAARAAAYKQLCAALREADLPRFLALLEAEQIELALARQSAGEHAGLFSLFAEAELLTRVSMLFPYKVIRPDQARQHGLIPGAGDLVLALDKDWVDPHFPQLPKPPPLELWEELTDASNVAPQLSLGAALPNPLERADPASYRDWLDISPHRPLIAVERGDSPPAQGFALVSSPGDDALMWRKRALTVFAEQHPGLAHIVHSHGQKRAFAHNSRPREKLEEDILSTRGVFVVQGPPGTGKTHLATQVITRLLGEAPDSRVLICAKEHFALDHILKKITDSLLAAGLPCRAWRSVSQRRLQRSRALMDARWLAPTITSELAEWAWRPDMAVWSSWQASIGDYDQRLTTLGVESANLCFCTTMDAAMVEMAGRVSFDLVIIEEAGKCYPSELLHALCLGRSVLMIGDHVQLPPYQEERTMAGVAAWRTALRRAMEDQAHQEALTARFGGVFSRLLALAKRRGPPSEEELAWLRPFEFLFHRSTARHRLEEQFRMEAPLSRLIGSVFYERPFEHRKPELVARGLIPARPLGDSIPDALDVPLLWIDTPHMTQIPAAGEDPAQRGTRDNLFELDVLLAYLKQLRPGASLDMVILTPYNAQKNLLLGSAQLRDLCATLTDLPLEQVVRTTDEYQGREAELTILSLVRNNNARSRAWGFMAQRERLNVMFSRTRFRQVVIGCSAHITLHKAECVDLYRVWQAYNKESMDPRAARIITPKELQHG